jgi:hypothetical protein
MLYLSRLKFRRKHFGVFPTLFQIAGIGKIALIKALFMAIKILVAKKDRLSRYARLLRSVQLVRFMVKLFLLNILWNRQKFLNYQLR